MQMKGYRNPVAPSWTWTVRALIMIVAWLSASGWALAQPVPSQQPDADPPARVARLAEFDGQVWFYGPDAGEWVAAVRNQPLTNGDRLATDAGARAQIEVGSTTLRLAAGTELEVIAIDDSQLALGLRSGSIAARVVDAAGAGQFTIDTDEGRFVVDRAGNYRFDRGDRAAFATVYGGQARYEGPNSALPLVPGQRVQFWIDPNGVAQYTLGAPANDAFAAWSNELDRRPPVNASVRFVSPEMTGAEDLDRYGRWEQSVDYGPLWIPTVVAADWAPYSTGRWSYVRPWGWTWIDEARWGFAPFHYGRWVYARDRWCWAPGTRVARPVYAPALVAWIGGPRGNGAFSGRDRSPAVGWIPLAPREVYVPSYRASPRYARNVNYTHVTNVTQINALIGNPEAPRDFANRRFPHAVTVVPAGVVSSRQPVAPVAAQWRQTPEGRDFSQAPGRTATVLAPPVLPPAGLAQGGDWHAVRPPPGAGTVRSQAEQPGFGRPGYPAWNGDRGRESGRLPWQQQQQQQQQPQVVQQSQQPLQPQQLLQPRQPQQAQQAQQPPPPAAPQIAAPAAATAPLNGAYPNDPRLGDRPWPPRGGIRPGEPRRDLPSAGPAMPFPRGNAVAPAPGATPQPSITAVEPPPATQPPMARPMPIRRGDERSGFTPRPVEGIRPAPAVAPPSPMPAPTMPMVPAPPRALEAPRPAGAQRPAAGGAAPPAAPANSHL